MEGVRKGGLALRLTKARGKGAGVGETLSLSVPLKLANSALIINTTSGGGKEERGKR